MTKQFMLPLLFFAIVLTALFIIFQPIEEKLMVYNPTDVHPELVDKSLQGISKNHTVADFELINQNGKTITQDVYKNKVYVADFFFTSCPSICPVMTNNMAKIQEEFLNDDNVMLLSLSVTPNVDNIPILREYANNKGVIDSKWNVTTGNKKHIYELARKSYFAATDEGDGGLQDFIHTSNFILVDKQKQIRGIYNGIDDKEILRLINDIKILTN
ncbi:SCO family protein [Flagellimonas hymeniacidonis]|uniref:SCO family protein n=1 Tax=Flagellimonas hymeniacidonis TaxID=2603628 RepID=A0A5C8V3L9_9FLAO|nr:SCO family protein [Flagellimonas hymeniacidonis]TXN35689.1 SCO family protein [Flagellimonas hymeniacidonis]